MSEEKQKTCPACAGKKVINGECVCDMEWRGSTKGDDWEDCQCTPDQECTMCSGTVCRQSLWDTLVQKLRDTFPKHCWFDNIHFQG